MPRTKRTDTTCGHLPHSAKGLCQRCYSAAANRSRTEAHGGAPYHSVVLDGPRVALCHPERPHKAFGRCAPCQQRWRAQHRTPENKEVRRRRAIDAKYGKGAADWFDKKLAEQGGVCAICRQPERAVNREFLSLDHDHDTGEWRGVTCIACNMGLGAFGDSVEALTQALAYLIEYQRRVAAA